MRAIVLAFLLVGCASVPGPGTVTPAEAVNRCQAYAYQKAEWGWGALGFIGGIIGASRAKDTPEYRDCMVQAGYP